MNSPAPQFKAIPRAILPSDWTEINAWFAAHKWPLMPLEVFPKVGLIVPGICAGFLYYTNSTIAWIEFLVANPDVDKQTRSEALDTLISKLIDQAKQDGFKMIFSSVAHEGLIDRYKSQGFMVTDTKMTNLIRSL